jgi:hypothetical protein
VNAVAIVGIIVGGLVLVVLIAAVLTPTKPETPQHPCYFQGVHVSLGDSWHTFEEKRGVPAGRKIGELPCSGPPEYSYAVQPGHPAHMLTSVKVCPAHVGPLHELAAALGSGTDGYWVVPND